MLMGDFLRGLDAWLEREDDRDDEEEASEQDGEKDDTASGETPTVSEATRDEARQNSVAGEGSAQSVSRGDDGQLTNG